MKAFFVDYYNLKHCKQLTSIIGEQATHVMFCSADLILGQK